MKKFLLIAFLFISSQEAFAAVGAPCGDYGECDSFKPELNNMESSTKQEQCVLELLAD